MRSAEEFQFIFCNYLPRIQRQKLTFPAQSPTKSKHATAITYSHTHTHEKLKNNLNNTIHVLAVWHMSNIYSSTGCLGTLSFRCCCFRPVRPDRAGIRWKWKSCHATKEITFQLCLKICKLDVSFVPLTPESLRSLTRGGQNLIKV